VLVVGGGAAGMFAAGTAASNAAARVTLLEKNDRLGKKLLITGKGRCNVTNDCPPDEVLKNVPRNPRFLYSAVYHFPPEKTKRFFEEHGCPLKTERGNRVFPVSDRSGDILDALRRWLRRTNVRIAAGDARQEIVTEDGCAVGVKTDRQTHYADCVILAVGGCSYPLTGSTGRRLQNGAGAGPHDRPARRLACAARGERPGLLADAGPGSEKRDGAASGREGKKGLRGIRRAAFHALRPLRPDRF
jgi:predicted Rossmann fold flavoprotein